MDENDYFKVNREAWNKKTAIHKNASFYDVPSFMSGKSTLNQAELEGLGSVMDKSMLHLQCHFGLDTLSWAREGARVTGIDFSDAAIQTAKQLSQEANIPASFICCNVYDTSQFISETFDIVFTSYGVTGWLPDLDRWAAVIATALKPGGTFFLAEFHPFVWMMDDSFRSIKYPYHNQEVIREEITGTYADRASEITYTEYGWNHSLSEVISSLLRHGLTIRQFKEYPYSYYPCFQNMVAGVDGNWRIIGLEDKIPMMYSLKATK